MLGYSSDVKQKLLEDGFSVQVIDPLPLAVNFAAMLVRSGLTHSKRAYGSSILKAWPGFEKMLN